jgi:predicted  nucleic acid-binding Zn-ribbon protein
MAKITDSDTPTPQPEDMHWGFSYLREDIQDMRQEFRGQIQEGRKETQKLGEDLRGEIQEGRKETQQLRQEFQVEMREMRKDMATRFNYTIGAMVTLAAGIAALIKV